jgi:hypothetical protein
MDVIITINKLNYNYNVKMVNYDTHTSLGELCRGIRQIFDEAYNYDIDYEYQYTTNEDGNDVEPHEDVYELFSKYVDSIAIAYLNKEILYQINLN